MDEVPADNAISAARSKGEYDVVIEIVAITIRQMSWVGSQQIEMQIFWSFIFRPRFRLWLRT